MTGNWRRNFDDAHYAVCGDDSEFRGVYIFLFSHKAEQRRVTAFGREPPLTLGLSVRLLFARKQSSARRIYQKQKRRLSANCGTCKAPQLTHSLKPILWPHRPGYQFGGWYGSGAPGRIGGCAFSEITCSSNCGKAALGTQVCGNSTLSLSCGSLMRL